LPNVPHGGHGPADGLRSDPGRSEPRHWRIGGRPAQAERPSDGRPAAGFSVRWPRETGRPAAGFLRRTAARITLRTRWLSPRLPHAGHGPDGKATAFEG